MVDVTTGKSVGTQDRLDLAEVRSPKDDVSRELGDRVFDAQPTGEERIKSVDFSNVIAMELPQK